MTNPTNLVNDLKLALKQSIEKTKKIEKKYSFKPSSEKSHEIIHEFSQDLIDLEMSFKFDYKLFQHFNSIVLMLKDEQIPKFMPLQAFITIFMELQKISFSEYYDDFVTKLQDINDRNYLRQIHKVRQLEQTKIQLEDFDKVIKNCLQNEEHELFDDKIMYTLDEKLRVALLRYYMFCHKNLSAVCNMLEKLHTCLQMDGKMIIENCYSFHNGQNNSGHLGYSSHNSGYIHNSIYG